MENKGNEIEKMAFRIFEKINACQDLMIFLELLNDKTLKEQGNILIRMKGMVMRAIQIGNYRHALLLLFMINKILIRFEASKDELRKRITSYMLGEA